MYEFKDVRQYPEGHRRLFSDDYFDLYVWYDSPGGRIVGFQLVYDKGSKERALTWRRQGGYAHDGVDTGESGLLGAMTPILVADGTFPKGSVQERFREASVGIDEDIRAFVLERLEGSDPALIPPSA